ncbi:MAG: carboxypeptidase-like regulatory domain-containing protein [Edaphobacter sp.]
MTTKRILTARWFMSSLALLLASFLVVTSAAHAQVSATVNGTVYDASGAVIPGATVTLTQEATREVRVSVTNNDGYFAFPALLTGNYSLKIEAKGFKSYQQDGISLSAGDLRKLAGLVLAVGQQGETVTVETSAQIIPVENGQRAAILDSKDIQQLAIQGRNLSELLKVLPGVTSVQNGLSNGAMFDPTVVSVASSAVGNGLNANGAPNRGGTSQLSDGVDIDDPGCNCNSIAILNPDMVQEVSVQTSNFGAEAPRGPIVINSISKSGGASYHGEGYFYIRNDIFNANDWQSDHAGTPKGSAYYYYPGGNIGGPVPYTHKKVLFWGGFEKILQNTGNANRLTSFIPTADMMAGNFTNTAANIAFCSGNLTSGAGNGCDNLAPTKTDTQTHIQQTGTVLPDGTIVGYGSRPAGMIPTQFLDPGAKALASFWPAANVTDPTQRAAIGGANYDAVIPGTHNGWLVRARVDYNLSDRDTFFISYQQGADAAPSQGNGAHIYWTPGNAIPYPGGGLISSSYSKAIAGHFTHVFSPTFTNEFIASWGYGNFPVGPPNASGAYRTTLGYPASYGTVFKTGSLLVPSYSSAGTLTFPDFSQQDIFETSGHYLVRKEMPAFSDGVTKVLGTHTLKVGVYAENVGNIQGASESPNGALNSFSAGGTNQNNLMTGNPAGSANNPTANFVLGNVTSYAENNSSPISDMAYQTLSFYVDDSYKASKRLNIQLGFRFEHIGHWYDRQGTGLAVFLPDLVASDQASGKLDPGVYWRGISPGITKAGSPDRFLFVSPRFGVSYDLNGTGKTILRGGWGAYRFADQYNDYTGALTTAQSIQGYGLPGQTNVLLSQIGSIAAPKPGGINGGVSTVGANDYGIPVTYTYNFTVSQQVPWNSLVEVAYVGSRSEQLLMGGESISGSGFTEYIDQNKVPLGAFYKPDPVTGVISPNPENLSQGAPNNKEADYRPFGAAYGTNGIDVNEHVGYANYNGLQTSWVKRSEHLTFNFNFTWSKTLGTALQEDPFVLRNNYGITSYDRPYVLNTSYAYNFGRVYHGDSHLMNGVSNGWTLTGITTWQSGGNLQATNSPNFGLGITGLSQNTYFGTSAPKLIQPILTCNAGANLAHNQRVNESCFAAPAVGTNGPANYAYYRNADFFDTDLAAYKSFHVTERQIVQFRLSAFNWVNHPLPQFSGGNQLQLHYNNDLTPNTSANSPTLGFLDTKAGGHAARILEMALKYNF